MTRPQSSVGQAVDQTLVFDARGSGQLFRRKGLLVRAGTAVLGCVMMMPLAGARQGTTVNQPLGAATGAGVGAGAGPGSARTDPMAPDPRNPLGLHVEHEMAERRSQERQKQLVSDTEKLLSLAQALKEEVDKSNKDELSVDVVKRAEQIEKLAKSVKDKMKGY